MSILIIIKIHLNESNVCGLMVQFNPDGSIKLPGYLEKQKNENDSKLKSAKCLKIKREIVSGVAPKACALIMKKSDAITDDRFIYNIFFEYSKNAETPMKIFKNDDGTYRIDIGTDFRRCTNCNTLIGKFREFLYGNIIEEKGECSFEGRKTNFSFEDHFD